MIKVFFLVNIFLKEKKISKLLTHWYIKQLNLAGF